MALERHVQMVVGSAIDTMTLATPSTPAVASMPVTNLQNQYKGRPMRRVGVDMNIQGVAAAPDYASAFALAWHNLPGAGDYRLRLYNSVTPGVGQVYDSGVLPVATPIPLGVFKLGVDPLGATYEQQSIHPSIAALFFDPIPYQSFQLDINAPGAASFDIGRLFLGQSFQPQINYVYGQPFETVDPSQHIVTGGGSLVTVQAEQYRRARVNLQHLDRAERERLSYELVRLGKNAQILLALDPGESGLLKIEQTLIGKRESNAAFNRRDATFYEHELIVRE